MSSEIIGLDIIMNFKDHFSKQSADYKRFRPQYPRELFEFVAAQCTERNVDGYGTSCDCSSGVL